MSENELTKPKKLDGTEKCDGGWRFLPMKDPLQGSYESMKASGSLPKYNPKYWSERVGYAHDKLKETEEGFTSSGDNEALLYPDIMESVRKFVDITGAMLDVGCCGGHFYEGLQHFIAREKPDVKLNWTGADITPEYIEIARARFPECTWTVADARDLPFPDKSFETTFCLFVLVHLDMDGVARAMKELTRVTRKNIFFAGYFSDVRVPGTQNGVIYDIVNMKELEPYLDGWQVFLPDITDMQIKVTQKIDVNLSGAGKTYIESLHHVYPFVWVKRE